MGASVTPDVGALQLAGFAPSVAGGIATQYLAYRLTVPGIGSTFAVADPNPLPDTDMWFTSVPGFHPWIAQEGEGPESKAAISIGGQRLELPLGRTTDGEVQIRLIDAPGPTWACGTAVVVPEGHADLNLGPNSFVAGPNVWGRWEQDSLGTSVDGTPALTGLGTIAIQVIGGEPGFGGHILFGSDTYNGYFWRKFDGTEGGGAGFVPGNRYAFRCRVSWGLDSGPGNLYIETIGGVDPFASTPGATVNRTSFPSGAYSFWTVDAALNTAVFNGWISAVADPSGEIEFRFGAEGYGGSCNVSATLTDMEISECAEIASVGSPYYITGWLSDDSARQQLLGRAAFLEESVDSGTTWSRVLYSGYLKQITLDAELTYLFTLGDAGRGRRVSRAWAGLDPVEDFTP